MTDPKSSDGLAGDDESWVDRLYGELSARLDEVDEQDDEAVSDAIAWAIESGGTSLADQWLERPGLTNQQALSTTAAFRERLHLRWGVALELLDLYITTVQEAGREINRIGRPVPGQVGAARFEALIRLHGKAVMTAKEVSALLSCGMATAAMSRWRTLHELWVVSLLIADNDDELADRYLAHHVVEALRGQRDYEETWEKLDHEAPDWSPVDRELKEAKLRKEFGRAFMQPNGWAAPLMPTGNRVTFRALAELADLDHWRGYYRMGSHGVHAGSQGLRWNLQLMDDTDMIVAGPSNAGLTDPAQNTVIALNGIDTTLTLFNARDVADVLDEGGADETEPARLLMHMVHLNARGRLKDRTVASFVEEMDRQREEEGDLSAQLDRLASVMAAAPAASSAELAERLDIAPAEVIELLAIGRQRAILASGEMATFTADNQHPTA